MEPRATWPNPTGESVDASSLLAACCKGDRASNVIWLALAQVRWGQVAGDSVARHTAVMAASEDGTVVVGVPSDAWVRRLVRQRTDLVAAFGRLPSGTRVRSLEFRVMEESALRARVLPRQAKGHRREPRSSVPEPPPLTPTQVEALNPLDRGAGEGLRGLFESWMRQTGRRQGKGR